ASIGKMAAAEGPASLRFLGSRLVLFLLQDPTKSSTDIFQDRSGRPERDFDQRLLVFRRRHARNRTNLRVTEARLLESLRDQRKLRQKASDPNFLARHRDPDTDPPRQPFRARYRAFGGPTHLRIEFANYLQQAILAGLELGRNSRNLITNLVSIHSRDTIK